MASLFRRTRRPTPTRPPARTRLALEPLEERVVPAGGDLDLSFALDGKQTIGFDLGGGLSDSVQAMVLDANGRIVLAGSVDRGNGNRDFAVARLNPDGSLDTTFDEDGKQTIAFDIAGFNVDVATAVALDAQGRIVVVGYAERRANDFDFAVARLNPNGDLDGTFGLGGKVIVSDDSFENFAQAVALDAQGRIVLAGSKGIGNNSQGEVVRLTTSGNRDNTFTYSTGIQKLFKGDGARAVAIDAQGRILLAGSKDVFQIPNLDFAVARLNADGILDESFGLFGQSTIAFDLGGSKADALYAMALDAQGRIVLAGSAAKAATNNNDFAVARLNPNGSLDNTFSGTGKRTIDFDLGGLNRDDATAVAIDAQGRIILTGFAEVNTNSFEFAVARFNPDGSRDTTFSSDGKQIIDVGPGNDFAAAVALDAQGRIVLAGTATLSNGNSDFAVARLISDIDPPPPPPGPRALTASVVTVKRKGRRRLRVVVRFADTGAVKAEFNSPFNKPAFRKIAALVLDSNGDGTPDSVEVSAVRVSPRRKRVKKVITV